MSPISGFAIILSAIASLAWSAPPVSAQAGAQGRTLTTSLGFAATTRNGRVESGGASALLEFDATRNRVRWTAYAQAHGIGVGCSDDCDLGGYSFGAALSYVRGPVAFGLGMGAIRRLNQWHGQPHLQGVLTRGPIRVQARLEVPGVTNDMSVPVLVGVVIPLG